MRGHLQYQLKIKAETETNAENFATIIDMIVNKLVKFSIRKAVNTITEEPTPGRINIDSGETSGIYVVITSRQGS